MPDARHPDVGALLPALVRDAGLEVVDAWAEAPAGVGPGPGRRLPRGADRGRPRRRPGRAAAARHRGRPPALSEPLRGRHAAPDEPVGSLTVTTPSRSGPRRRRRRRRAGPAPGRPGAAPLAAAAAASTPTRWSPTTWPTPPPRSRRPGPRSTTAPRATSRPRIACAFVADACADLAGRVLGREAAVGRRAGLGRAGGRLPRPRTAIPACLAALAGERGPAPPRRRLRAGPGDVPPLRRGARSGRVAEHIHRHQRRHPRGDHRRAWPRWAASACRSPRSTAASPRAARATTWAWSSPPRSCRWGSLGAGGSLITRPEILTRALVNGGTEEQKQQWLPKLAIGRGHGRGGRHRARLRLRRGRHRSPPPRRPTGGWVINGVKTWCTFAARADVLMLLARTDPDRSHGPPGPVACSSSPKPQGDGHGFVFTQDGADGRPAWPGRMEGRPIDTLGYRGMHSYELAFENWFVPDANLIGGDGRARARASTSRCRASRTAGCRPRPGPSASCRPPTRRPSPTPPNRDGVRPPDRRLPADPGQAGPHGGASSRPPASSRTRWPG